MALHHWIRETREELRSNPSRETLEIALRKFWAGALGRLLSPPEPGTPIWDYDWDVLVIFDGCRVDAMRELAADGEREWLPSPEAIARTWSLGSTSDEWLRNTFSPEYEAQMRRTAYVTGNPYTPTIDDRPLGLLRHVRLAETDHGISTVAPRSLTDPAIDVFRRRGELDVDRVIVHYMQPHTPFRSRPEWFSEFDGDGKFGSEVWWRLCTGALSKEAFWDAYLDNLRWVIDEVALLRECVDGRIVVTADHGNAMGEWGIYGHPEGVPVPAVRTVPTFSVSGTDTGDYAPEETASSVDTVDSADDRRAQLEALGYA